MFEVNAKADKEVEVNMYGTIHQWEELNAAMFIAAIEKAMALNPTTVIFPTHCPGGNIHEGVAMISNLERLRQKGIKSIMRVDGLSCSMSAVFGSACDEVEVSPYARLMVHEGRTGVYATAKELREAADNLDTLNSDMAKIHAGKISKKHPKRDAKWVSENWMNGKDVWFTAQKAIDEGLADRTTPVIVKDLPKLSASADWTQAAAHYDNHFKTTDNEMNKEELIALLGLKANATDAEIKTAMAEMKAKADKAPATPPKEKEKQIELKAEAGDANSIMLLEAMAKDRGVTDEKKLAAIRTVAAINLKAALDLLPEKAEVKAAATETKEEAPKPLSMAELLAAMKGEGSGAGKKDSASWGWDDWNKPENAKAFGELLKTDPKKYAEVINAKFGYTPTEAELKAL